MKPNIVRLHTRDLHRPTPQHSTMVWVTRPIFLEQHTPATSATELAAFARGKPEHGPTLHSLTPLPKRWGSGPHSVLRTSTPFITTHASPTTPESMPTTIHWCPAMGLCLYPTRTATYLNRARTETTPTPAWFGCGAPFTQPRQTTRAGRNTSGQGTVEKASPDMKPIQPPTPTLLASPTPIAMKL